MFTGRSGGFLFGWFLKIGGGKLRGWGEGSWSYLGLKELYSGSKEGKRESKRERERGRVFIWLWYMVLSTSHFCPSRICFCKNPELQSSTAIIDRALAVSTFEETHLLL